MDECVQMSVWVCADGCVCGWVCADECVQMSVWVCADGCVQMSVCGWVCADECVLISVHYVRGRKIKKGHHTYS